MQDMMEDVMWSGQDILRPKLMMECTWGDKTLDGRRGIDGMKDEEDGELKKREIVKEGGGYIGRKCDSLRKVLSLFGKGQWETIEPVGAFPIAYGHIR